MQETERLCCAVVDTTVWLWVGIFDCPNKTFLFCCVKTGIWNSQRGSQDIAAAAQNAKIYRQLKREGRHSRHSRSGFVFVHIALLFTRKRGQLKDIKELLNGGLEYLWSSVTFCQTVYRCSLKTTKKNPLKYTACSIDIERKNTFGSLGSFS